MLSHSHLPEKTTSEHAKHCFDKFTLKIGFQNSRRFYGKICVVLPNDGAKTVLFLVAKETRNGRRVKKM